MLCPECNISGGCDCYPYTGREYRPIDHEKELDRWLLDLDTDTDQELKRLTNY